MVFERLINKAEKAQEWVMWENKPTSVGTARVTHVDTGQDELLWDEVFIDCGGNDITATAQFFTPHRGEIKSGDIVEVIVINRRQLACQKHFSRVKVAIRPYNQRTFGVITENDSFYLRPMLDYPDNQQNVFFNRAFFRRFLDKHQILSSFPPPGE